MSESVYHEFDYEGKHYRFVYDEHYEIDKSCGAMLTGGHGGDAKGSYCSRDGGTEEECQRFAEEEYEKLESGDWVALAMIVTKKCEGPHCEGCRGVVQVEAVGGIVLENLDEAVEEFVREGGI